jgi:hypothetical protein
MPHVPYHNRIFFYGSFGVVNAYCYVRFCERQKRIENAYPERDVEHDLYPVFLPDLKHIIKGKTPGMAKKLMLLNH